MRGIFLECCSLGLTVVVFITIVGVPLGWAIAIGIFTGASNVDSRTWDSPRRCSSALAYALLAENVHPLLPLVTADTFAIWVVAAVALAELLKNVLYEPIVLGGAVKLHPLVVVIGVVGGAILFGPAGMFLADSDHHGGQSARGEQRQTPQSVRAGLKRSLLRPSPPRHPPERPRDLLEGPAGLVGPQAVSQHRNDVGAHPRIGNEVAVAEEVGRPADLDDVDCAQRGDRFDLVSAEHRRVDPPEPGDAAEQPARRRERLVVGRNVEGDPEAR